ncbi:hypothetical protein ACX12L_12095 [Alicycliphilus sp. T452]
MLVLDPQFFRIDAIPGTAFESRLKSLKVNLRSLLNICQKLQLKIAVEKDAWRYLEANRIKPIVDLGKDHELNVALSVLRQKYLSTIPETNITGCRTWGIRPLFNGLANPEDLLLANSVTASILYIAKTGSAAYFFIQNEYGRNIVQHSSGHSKINEIIRWRIYLTAPNLAGPQYATCIRHQRNITTPWTTRYDITLPDVGSYFFVPPNDWHKRSTNSVRTIRSKPAFVDIVGNGWSNPNTPGVPEHWDLFIEDATMAKDIGLDQLNIWKYLCPSEPGGELHHVPRKKASRLQ